MIPAPPKPVRYGDLGVRGASGLVLGGAAAVNVWFGGPWVWGLAVIATLLMMWEYHRIVTGLRGFSAPAMWLMGLSGTASVTVTAAYGLAAGALTLAVGAVAVAVLARERAKWFVPGMIYISLAMCYLTVLRDSEVHGLPTVLWLILVVVAADVGAYFVGRRVGGPRLWPAVSPGKTWSGAFGGLGAALLTGLGFALLTERGIGTIAVHSLGIAIASQFGDLLESAVKRRFSVKDTSRLIPGHGGVLDRLDGLMGGLWFYAIQGLVFGGFLG